ncbi:MAG: hypothetical protein COV29_02260 [Candidatus Yanofskybacteria bacterium CG10_big_fil_rev_8_21_14_0_10_36_16]|uniref:Uncharacterized protein n=1 Tax=Candidatus Yanofskybacteria bacterium CG10_big_fil_rev_8_21_14_0_10_36_16 TaxID=1975096 RepID=A0A2J0Q7X0_9BACT|nr:MAG: hypothetical protein COV29_02260 [Candidatus Yanofskybacteria bacterium CG10_big_fil_rev_8_21_14_0_10_36_16]
MSFLEKFSLKSDKYGSEGNVDKSQEIKEEESKDKVEEKEYKYSRKEKASEYLGPCLRVLKNSGFERQDLMVLYREVSGGNNPMDVYEEGDSYLIEFVESDDTEKKMNELQELIENKILEHVMV